MGIKLVKLTKKYKDQLFEMMDEWSNSDNTNHSPYAIFFRVEQLNCKYIFTIGFLL